MNWQDQEPSRGQPSSSGMKDTGGYMSERSPSGRQEDEEPLLITSLHPLGVGSSQVCECLNWKWASVRMKGTLIIADALHADQSIASEVLDTSRWRPECSRKDGGVLVVHESGRQARKCHLLWGCSMGWCCGIERGKILDWFRHRRAGECVCHWGSEYLSSKSLYSLIINILG